MQLDARSLDADREIQTDVCIVGAGPAGITLALELERLGVGCCLLEGGGLAFEAAVQDLYAGTVDGSYYPLHTARLRWLGGTSNHWAGHCPELEPDAFRLRPWVADVGWPFGRDRIAPYYERAAGWLELAPPPPPPGQGGTPPALPLDPEVVETQILRFSPPTRFGTRYRDALQKSDRVHLVLHANVTRVQRAREAGRVDAVHAATLSGRKLTVRGRHTVLATGGIENARLLLASNDVETAGLGNGHDLVGRFFMDHLALARGGRWMLAGRVPTALYEWPEQGLAGAHMGILILAAAAARARKLAKLHCWLDFSSPGRESEGWRILRRLRVLYRHGEMPDDLVPDIRAILSDLGGVLSGLREEVFGFGKGAFAWLHCEAEQRPAPDNRVTLDTERDALGEPRARLRWRISDEDFATLDRGRRVLAEEIGRAGLGRVQLDPNDGWRDRVVGAYHHMGTTRMAEDPRQGVVDPEGRVHGLGNLWIAGSSVFPTCGVANPTFTLVALAVRMAEKLAQEVTA